MLVTNLDSANQRISQFSPRKKWYRRLSKRSAVALILRQGESGLEALMIKRADREGDPWSGHMAFPGGRADASDRNILHTARRETWEEIGLDTDLHTEYRGRLSDIPTRPHRGMKRMVVTPYVFSIDQVPALNINHEVAEVIWIPLDFLAASKNREHIEWQRKKAMIKLPCYYYQQRRIWGLSLLMLDELIGLVRVKP